MSRYIYPCFTEHEGNFYTEIRKLHEGKWYKKIVKGYGMADFIKQTYLFIIAGEVSPPLKSIEGELVANVFTLDDDQTDEIDRLLPDFKKQI